MVWRITLASRPWENGLAGGNQPGAPRPGGTGPVNRTLSSLLPSGPVLINRRCPRL